MVLKLIEREIEEFQHERNVFLENIKTVAKKYGLECYLTGSRAKGEHLPSSDMDVLVVIPQSLWKLRWKIYDEMKRACKDNAFVEIHIMNEKTFDEMKKLYGKLIPLG